MLETEHGFLSETTVILDYIEQTQGGKPLLPADAFAQAKVRELVKEIELYIELPARTCYSEAFFGMAVEPLIRSAPAPSCWPVLPRSSATASLPYVAGETLTLADLMFCFSVDLACAVGKKVLNVDFLAEFPEAKALLEVLGANPHMAKIVADKEAAMPTFRRWFAASAERSSGRMRPRGAGSSPIVLQGTGFAGVRGGSAPR